MSNYRKGGHTKYDVQYHIVWITKYRRKVLKGKLAERLKIILLQVCEQNNIIILKGKVMEDHVHLMLSSSPSIAPSKIVQLLKGRSSKMIQEEIPEIKKKYWGQHIWGTGYFIRTVGAVTESMIRDYVESQNDEVHEIFG